MPNDKPVQDPMPYIEIRTTEEADKGIDQVRCSARQTVTRLAELTKGDPLDVFSQLKFQLAGYHPISHRPVNLIEQVNQLWTFLVALTATKKLIELHG